MPMRTEASAPMRSASSAAEAGACDLLGDREGRRQDRHREMTDVGEMRVVVIARMRGGAIGERGWPRLNLLVQSRDGGRLVAAFVGGSEAANDSRDGLVLACSAPPRTSRRETGAPWRGRRRGSTRKVWP